MTRMRRGAVATILTRHWDENRDVRNALHAMSQEERNALMRSVPRLTRIAAAVRKIYAELSP